MKRLIIIFLIGLSFVGFLALFTAKKSNGPAAAEPKASERVESAAIQQPVKETAGTPGTNDEVTTNPPIPWQALKSRGESTNQTERAQWITNEILQRNVPISFWGRVFDQDNSPVAGAKVSMTLRHWSSESATNTDAIHENHEVITDSDGKFELVGVSGDVLNLESVQKRGFRLSEKAQRAFAYSQSATIFQPDPQSPVIIRMWKLGTAERLVSTRALFGFEPDGRSYGLDLLAKKKIEGENPVGDLVVKFRREPIKQPREPYTWTLQIAAVDGGIQETKDEQTYAAPESGYKSSITIQMDKVSSDWSPSTVKDFYFSTRNRSVYGAVHMRIESNYNGQSAIFVESRANPNSSRNLQP